MLSKEQKETLEDTAKRLFLGTCLVIWATLIAIIVSRLT